MTEKNMVRKSNYPMLSVAEALELTLKNTPRTKIVKVDLSDICGKVAAENVKANQPYPTFPASIMDGYCALAPFTSGNYAIQKRLHAGNQDESPLEPGKVAYITTGARVPAGANTVIKIEDTEVGISIAFMYLLSTMHCLEYHLVLAVLFSILYCISCYCYCYCPLIHAIIFLLTVSPSTTPYFLSCSISTKIMSLLLLMLQKV
jgi:hypothetical protein